MTWPEVLVLSTIGGVLGACLAHYTILYRLMSVERVLRGYVAINARVEKRKKEEAIVASLMPRYATQEEELWARARQSGQMLDVRKPRDE